MTVFSLVEKYVLHIYNLVFESERLLIRARFEKYVAILTTFIIVHSSLFNIHHCPSFIIVHAFKHNCSSYASAYSYVPLHLVSIDSTVLRYFTQRSIILHSLVNISQCRCMICSTICNMIDSHLLSVHSPSLYKSYLTSYEPRAKQFCQGDQYDR